MMIWLDTSRKYYFTRISKDGHKAEIACYNHADTELYTFWVRREAIPKGVKTGDRLSINFTRWEKENGSRR